MIHDEECICVAGKTADDNCGPHGPGPQPVGEWRCVGCGAPAQPLVTCACGWMVAEARP